MKYFRQTLHQPQLLFATLMLTGILSLSVGVTKARATAANSPGVLLTAENNQYDLAILPSSIANVVLKTASQRTGLPTSSLRITNSIKIEGSSSCLGIPPGPGEACTADLAPIWQVTVAGGYQQLVYHTSIDGAKIKLNQTASWNIKLLAASSLLIIVPLLAFYAYRTRVREKIS
ncbi:MAG TPA: hypothetical protein V6C85_13790 [Allocoleopsis sp.]